MQQIGKHFSERLNKILDELDMPTPIRERALLLSKMLAIPKQQAWSLLDGHLIPDNDLLERIAAELEVEPHQLTGDKK
ncbi:MAG: hypothetical protein V4501_04465 [Pseudomonadota bacterium]